MYAAYSDLCPKHINAHLNSGYFGPEFRGLAISETEGWVVVLEFRVVCLPKLFRQHITRVTAPWTPTPISLPDIPKRRKKDPAYPQQRLKLRH